MTKGKERAPHRSGEDVPLRAFEAFKRGRRETSPIIYCARRRVCQRCNRDCPRQGRQTSRVTGCAIGIATNGLAWIRRCVFAIRGLVLVVMVTKVLGCGTGFVLAIAGCSRPAKLKRHEYQQKDRQPFTHLGNSVAAIDFPVNLFYLFDCFPSNLSPLKTTIKLAPMSANTPIHMEALSN